MNTDKEQELGCSNHRKDLFGRSDMKVVAEAIGDLHYEAMVELFDNLTLKFRKDGIKDIDGERVDIGDILLQSSGITFRLAKKIRVAWKISKPFMRPPIPPAEEKTDAVELIEILESAMTDFGEAHNLLAKSTLPREEYNPISGLLAKAKVELFKVYRSLKSQPIKEDK